MSSDSVALWPTEATVEESLLMLIWKFDPKTNELWKYKDVMSLCLHYSTSTEKEELQQTTLGQIYKTHSATSALNL